LLPYFTIYLAERQKTDSAYGYCVVKQFYLPFLLNIAMVIGIFPTIGVPASVFLYGGSDHGDSAVLFLIFLKWMLTK
jgi:rod shape determining protein RodA